MALLLMPFTHSFGRSPQCTVCLEAINVIFGHFDSNPASCICLAVMVVVGSSLPWWKLCKQTNKHLQAVSSLARLLSLPVWICLLVCIMYMYMYSYMNNIYIYIYIYEQRIHQDLSSSMSLFVCVCVCVCVRVCVYVFCTRPLSFGQYELL